MTISAFQADDFLRRSVNDLWDQKLIGRITDFYSSTVTVHLPGNAIQYGSDEVMNNAITWWSAFPDIQAFVDSVIWHGDGQEYRTSLRFTLVGHNTGPSVYGSATGRRIVISTIVNARIREERFVEQWIEYDEVDLIEQLGLDVQTILQSRNEANDMEAFADDVGHSIAPASVPDLADETSELKGGELVHAALETLWNGRLAAAVSRFYSQRYRARINARQIFGPDEMQFQVLEMLAALPDLRVYIDDVICRDQPEGQCTSARWTLLGTNSGPSRYARPSNRYVRLTGITNHHIVDSRFQAGWTHYNELSLLQQLTPKRETVPQSECDG